MATIKDVAVAAGVKPATVSYVLNGTGSVGATTRARVLAAVEALQYHPSHTARSLQRRQSKTLGLVVPPERDPAAWGLVVNGLVDTATEHGFELLVSTAGGERSASRLANDLIGGGRVDGIVLFNPSADDLQALGLGTSLPIVATTAGAGYPSVVIDNIAGMVEAVGHLIVQGHERIGLITPPLEWSIADEQEAGYRLALSEAGLEFDPELVIEGGASERSGHGAALELLAQQPPPTALVAGLAALAFGAFQAINELGLTVGREVALLAGEDPRAAAYLQPPLTALRQPYYALGQALARTLIERLHGGAVQDHVLFPQLMVRHSCGE